MNGKAEPMALLRLSALDADDLAVISAHMQDAVVLVGDIHYLKRQKKLALIANRFDWEAAAPGVPPRDGHQRRRTGLQFARVLGVKSRRIRLGADDAVLSLLSIGFVPGAEEPAGEIELTFSGGGALRISVECIEASIEDLGPVWETQRQPRHEAAEQD